MVKCVSILGSTGSIGRQSLDVISHLPDIRVAALTAGSGVERMVQQCRRFHPELAVMATQEAAMQLETELNDASIAIAWGEEGLIRAATLESVDCVITAVVGMVGLKPTLAAIRAKKRIGLANKETLVCAGELVMAEAEKYGAEIIPVDSEHSAIFQCLMGCGDRREVKRILLTCSGGVIAPVLQLGKTLQKNRRGAVPAGKTYNTTHRKNLVSKHWVEFLLLYLSCRVLSSINSNSEFIKTHSSCNCDGLCYNHSIPDKEGTPWFSPFAKM